jgi:glucosamine-6-phosphate deaminase
MERHDARRDALAGKTIMRELLGARRVRLYTDGGAWKQTILRILLFAEPTVEYPVTLVQDHPDVHVICDAASAAPPPIAW